MANPTDSASTASGDQPVVRDELIALRGLRLHYRDWANPTANAPTLVCLHGYTGHARTWDHLAGQLTDHYRVIALDQRGHGESSWATDGQYDNQDMVDDLSAFVGALGLQQFDLLGLSMGGLVAIGYAGTQPAALRRLIIVDIAPEIDKAGLTTIQNNVARSDVFASREAAFERARVANSRPPLEHHRQRVDNSLMRTAEGNWTWRYDPVLRDNSAHRERLSADEGWRLVSQFNVPTLLLRGEHSDILSEAVAAKFIATAPDARLQQISGAGHPIPLDQPERFAAAVRKELL